MKPKQLAIKYACPKCHNVFNTLKEARSCQVNLIETLNPKAGDFLSCHRHIYKVVDVGRRIRIVEDADWDVLCGGQPSRQHFAIGPWACKEEGYREVDEKAVRQEISKLKKRLRAGERLLKNISEAKNG